MKITSNSYSFVESASSNEDWHLKINEGEYKGIVYKYGRIEVNEPTFGQENATLKFQFKVEKIPTDAFFTEDDLHNDEAFMNLLGDILTHVIEDAMDSGKYKLGNDDKPTDSESTVHE